MYNKIREHHVIICTATFPEKENNDIARDIHRGWIEEIHTEESIVRIKAFADVIKRAWHSENWNLILRWIVMRDCFIPETRYLY
jgi:hypothetical protein